MIRNFTLLTLFFLLAQVNISFAQWNVQTFAGNGSEGTIDGTATEATFWNPKGMVMDSEGNIYVADDYSNKIRMVAPDGTVSTFAGTGEPGMVNGNVKDARFFRPQDIVLDDFGNFYVADALNQVIRKITPDGEVSVLVGIPGVSGTNDGLFNEATFNFPAALAMDGNNILYVACINLIRKIDLDEGSVSTVYDSQYFIWGIDTDAEGNIYFPELDNHKIKVLTIDGSVLTLAGSGTQGCLDGGPDDAQFSAPEDVAVDDQGNVYVADGTNHRVRHIAPDGVVTTIAGGGDCTTLFWSEEPIVDGLGEFARLGRLRGILLKSDGNLLVTSWDDDAIREIQNGVTSPPIVAILSEVDKDYEVTTPNQSTPIFFTSAVQNVSDVETVEGISVAVNIYLDGNLELSIPSNTLDMGPGEVDVLDIDQSFTPTKVGQYEVIFEYSAPSLGVFAEARDKFEISETTLAQDDGHQYFFDGASIPTSDSTTSEASYGLEYELIAFDTLESITFRVSAQGDGFRVLVHEFPNPNTPGAAIFTSDSLSFPQFVSEINYVLPTPLILPPGKYLFAIEKNDPVSSLVIGADSDNQSPKNWIKSPAINVFDWLPAHNFVGIVEYLNFMIRPNFSPVIISNVDEVDSSVPTFSIYPNPTSGFLNIQFSETIQEGFIEVTDMSGRPVLVEKIGFTDTIQKEVEQLASGTYIVRVWDGKAWGVKRFMKL
jgi:sugar lactone lactonase YvrE